MYFCFVSSVVMFFEKRFMFCMCLYVFLSIVNATAETDYAKTFTHKTTKRKQKRNRKASRQTEKQKYRISSPRIYANKYHISILGDSWAGYPVFSFFYCYVVLEAFMCFFLFCFLLCLFSHSLFQRLHLQSTKYV